MRGYDSTSFRKLLAQSIDAVIVALLLVEIVGCQAELEDRNARSIVLHESNLWY